MALQPSEHSLPSPPKYSFTSSESISYKRHTFTAHCCNIDSEDDAHSAHAEVSLRLKFGVVVDDGVVTKLGEANQRV
jgi:hypothetical protein